jgi:hypothetical protein
MVLDEPPQTEVHKNRPAQPRFEATTLAWTYLRGHRRGGMRPPGFLHVHLQQVLMYHILTDHFRCEDVHMRLD